jgi:hypothetical protein
MFQSDLLNLEGEGSGPAVLGSFSVGVEGGMGMGGLDGLGMGLEERVAVGMERMAERMAELEARVEELEAQLSVKKTVAAAVSTPVKTVTEKTAPSAPVKTVAKKEKTAVAVPVMTPLDAPTPASYRLAASVVAAHTKCQARKEPPQGGSGKGWDKRYSPSVFWEQLCNGDQETDGLCKTCLRYRDQNPKKWHGLITEDPLPESHMLGTAWAAKCKWTGAGSAPVSSAASVASEESVQTPAPVSAATVAPMDAAAAAAAAQAKKEAAAAKRKATLAKKKEAAAASASTAAVATETVVTPAAASTTEPVADAGELRMLQGEFYWMVGSNVYEYDQIEEKPGDYVGRVRADETIDGDAEEEGAVESDGE